MWFAPMLLPLTLALAAVADLAGANTIPNGVSRARQFRRAPDLSRRLDTPDIDPEVVCGKGFHDCGEGYCCSASQKCAGKLNDVPVCNDPTVTSGPLTGTVLAMPFEDLDEKLSSMTAALADGSSVPRAGGPDEPADSKETGAAAMVGINSFGTMVGVVVGVWGVAAFGGAGLLLL